MTDLFFFGTLRHAPLLSIVLGRGPAQIDITPAELPDHAVHWVRDQPFPIIIAEAGACAQGMLVRGLSGADLARLRFYEGGFGYDLVPVTVRTGNGKVSAQMFFAEEEKWPVGALWSLADWAARWGAISEEAAREVMSLFGRWSPQDVAVRFDAIRRRAAARVAARQGAPDRDRDLSRDVRAGDHRLPYANFFALEEVDLSVRQHDGTMGPKVNRAALVVGQAAVVLPYDPARDEVLLVEQFRAPVYLAGDPAPWVWEPVAGLLDPGEDAETAARREAHEEAGIEIDRLEPVAQVYSSTGSSTEFLHLFVGLTQLDGPVAATGGTDLGEDIRTAILPFTELIDRVDAGLYRDMPLVTTALWLARHRGRLRSAL
ncbi:NUDIX domain-containing protein [Sedimentitalea arenosa]|uniref:ADP-ribose pyrophosphatase n=1 Tax=Sedimentitalea arenosa TaxID=2798803 RepID=A0A8J7J8J0_9RHOB|nr:NUDIX domain-containing protein [Arenibacterium arenosum]MBJ6370754.1 NUDIX domain-containing protein [Arenibacterium arenosum]